MLENETAKVKAEVAALCEKALLVREEEEVKRMLDENFTEEDAKRAIRKQ